MSSSFRRSGKAKTEPSASSRSPFGSSQAVFERVGTKPWIGGLTLTSSGLRELDAILGGGQPLGTSIMIEEDRWTQDLALALARYWSAEAMAQDQSLVLVSTLQDVDTMNLDCPNSDDEVHAVQFQQGMSRRGLLAFLQMLPRDQHLDKSRAKSEAMDKKINSAISNATVSSLQGFGTIEEGEDFDEEEEETTEATDAGLTNAWQYKASVQRERMGIPVTNRSVAGAKVFCHSFDLSGTMSDQHNGNWLDERRHLCLFDGTCSDCNQFACHQSSKCAMAFFQSCTKKIEDSLSQNPNTVVRMLIMNAPVKMIAFALPLLLSHVRKESLPVVFLTTVRSWLCPLKPSTSFSTLSYSKALISLRRTCDAVFKCEGFSAMMSPPPPEFSDLAGILTIRKVALQALSHFSDTTTNRRPPANRYGMKRDRRKMHIRMLHLPPEDFSAGGSSVGTGVRSGAGKLNEKNLPSKETSGKTALQPGMGCSSNQRPGTSTATSLEF